MQFLSLESVFLLTRETMDNDVLLRRVGIHECLVEKTSSKSQGNQVKGSRLDLPGFSVVLLYCGIGK